MVLMSGYATSQLPAPPDDALFMTKPFRVPDLLAMLADGAQPSAAA